jgi:cyclophilin family peptidyl-prolyl cis-trans isomerase
MHRRHLLAGVFTLMTTASMTTGALARDPENTLLIELSSGGTVVVEMLPDAAPQHVARIKQLAREGFYDGIVFHRVIPGFMAQTGDPTGTGRGGSDKPDLPAEFSKIPFKRGTVGMARTQNPNSANSQFFIMFAPAPHLNGQYTVWGQVVEGMDHVDAIAKGEPPRNPDRMVKVRVAADAQ